MEENKENINVDIVNGIGAQIKNVMAKYTLLLENKIPLHYDEIAKKINTLINYYNSIDKSMTTFTIKTYFYLKEFDYESLLLEIKYLFIESHPVLIQAMWHIPGSLSTYFDESNKDGVKSLLKASAECGFNRIYVETNSKGTSYYKSNILISHKTYGKPYGDYRDYLECFIEEAHKLNIEVITWVQVLRVSDDDTLASCYKEEWVSLDYNGKKSTFLDSTNDEVHKFLISQFTELVKIYKMDGLEYDYIRYKTGNILSNPSEITDYGYNEGSIKQFQKLYGYSINDDIKTILKDKRARTNWVEFKKKRITDLLVSSKKALREIRPDLILSAAVFSSPNAINEIMQDWPKWLDEEIVDFVEPMIYQENTETFINKDVVRFLSAVLSDDEQYIKKKVIIGIGNVCEGGDYREYFDQIEYVLSLHHSYSIFDLKLTLQFNKLVNAFKKYNYAPISITNKYETKVKAIANDLLKKIEGFYKNVSEEDFSSLTKYLNYCKDEQTESNVKKVFEAIKSIEDDKIRENIYNLFVKVN